MQIYINREHLLKEIDYPQRYRPECLLRTAAVIFGMVLVFLLLFKPFGVYAPEQKINYFLICCLHALSSVIIVYVYFTTLNYLREKGPWLRRWTLLREYVQIGIVLLLQGISSFLMRDLVYRNADNWSWRYFGDEIRNCLVAGIFFYFLLRLATFYFQSQKGSPFVLQFIPLKAQPKKTMSPSLLFIKTQVKQDDFSLHPDDLLFVKAEGNYIELTTRTNNQVHTGLKRISLTQLESQLSGYPNLFRCHRAYLVNLFHIAKVSGNSQGYLLAFEATGLKVPVSRAQLDSFNSRYEQLRQQYSA